MFITSDAGLQAAAGAPAAACRSWLRSQRRRRLPGRASGRDAPRLALPRRAATARTQSAAGRSRRYAHQCSRVSCGIFTWSFHAVGELSLQRHSMPAQSCDMPVAMLPGRQTFPAAITLGDDAAAVLVDVAYQPRASSMVPQNKLLLSITRELPLAHRSCRRLLGRQRRQSGH